VDGAPPLPPAEVAVSAFLGTWQFTDGTSLNDCNGGQPTVETATGRFDLTRGLDAPLLYVEGQCTFRLDVAGDLATYRTAPSCTFADGATVITLTPIAGTIQVGGATATLKATFSALVDAPGGRGTCRIELNARATRVQ
jgi:hypothetical protein